jgi:hypothetical protein
MDIVYVGAAVALVLLAIGLVEACDRLRGTEE